MTKTAELRALDDADLSARLSEAHKELFNLRFQLATGRLDNLSRINELRREIARLLTLQGERSRGDVRAPAASATGSRPAGRAKRNPARQKNEEE